VQNEEDQMLKEKLELLVERLSDKDQAQREFGLAEISKEIKGATSSMTSVPKPLKFLSVMYKDIVKCYEAAPAGEFKVSLWFKALTKKCRINWLSSARS